jgi:hypothetical protein
VPVLVWVINALSWALSMATPAPRLFADHRKPSGVYGFIETHWVWFHDGEGEEALTCTTA